MYQPVLSRFQSLDPLSPNGVDLLDDNNWFGDRLTRMRMQYGDGGVMSGYAYANNNPMRYIDPSGQRAFDCVKHFPITIFLERAKGKIGPNCKPEDLHKIMLQCMIDNLADATDFAKCMEDKCGPGDYKKMTFDVICDWIAHIFTCTHFESQGWTYNPCECGIDPMDTKKEYRKCLSPKGGDAFDNALVCQECCNFIHHVDGVKTPCELIKKGGKMTPIDLLLKALDKETPTKCLLHCTKFGCDTTPTV